MRLTLLLFFLVPILAWGQDVKDSLSAKEQLLESLTKNYSQEDKIFNRSVWTFIDNPALAGFDRKLAVAYRFRMKNLSMGVPNDDGNLELAFMKHEAFVDLSTGGPKQNWGTAVYYSNEKELQHTYHRVQVANSIRLKLINQHYLLFGFSVGLQFSKLEDWNKLTFMDMIESRSGFIYPTHEHKPATSRFLPYLDVGLRYYWKRFAFDYALRAGPNGSFALAGFPTNVFRNKLKAVYHFNIGNGVTVSPEIMGEIITRGIRTSYYGLFSGFATITYKDMAYGQLGVADLNRLSFRAGYQLKDMLVVEAGISSYLDKTMEKIGGIASVDVGVRYQIRPWYR